MKVIYRSDAPVAHVLLKPMKMNVLDDGGGRILSTKSADCISTSVKVKVSKSAYALTSPATNQHRLWRSPLLEQAQLQIEPGERVFIVGRNGEGKSTLLKLIEGVLEPDEGERIVHPDIRIRSLSQEVPEDLACRLDHLVLEGVDPALEEWEATQAVEQTLSLMQLDKHAAFHTLSGGQKRRALLAKAWVSQPDLLILDEPTNHLDIETILWMEKMLLRFKGSLLCVTHDRAFLQGLATRIVELDRGQLHSWNCAYKTYLKRKEALLEQEAENWAQFDKKLAKEERWIRQGIKARRTRNEGRVRALKKMREER